MVKSCLGERLKKVYFSPYFTYQRAFFSRWPSQTAIGGIRNLEESGVNTGIPVPQEFLQKFL